MTDQIAAPTGEPRPLTLAFIAEPNSVHTRRWIGFFAERGHHVHLIVRSTAHVDAGLDPRIQVHTYKAWPRTYIPGIGAMLTRMSIRGALRRIRPDVLHAHYLSWYGWAAWLSGFRPYVITVWGSDVFVAPYKSSAARRWGPRTLAGAALVTAVSEDLARGAIALGAHPDSVKIVQFGVDPDRFYPAPAPASLQADLDLAGHRVVFGPRAQRPKKSQEIAQEALAQLPDDVVLLLIRWQPDPAYLASIETLIRERGLEKRIRWLGPIDHDDMADHYRIADVVVSLPITDAFPVTALEAMACGVPVVLGDIPSAHEGIDAVDPSAIVPGDDPGAVAGAILARLELTPEARADLGARLRAAALDRGDVRRNLTAMEESYRSLAAAATSAGGRA
jgi:glycosyltransferase involved in cell wall biosynthesis